MAAIYAGIVGALVIFVAWMYVVGTSLPNVVFGTVAGILFGIVLAAIFDRFHRRSK
jgi:hypothetical protein